MHVTRDYSKSEAPNWEAVNDVMNWLGDRYSTLAALMRTVIDPDEFALCCELLGFSGKPVQAWYDHFHGEGNFAFRVAEKEAMGEIVDVSGML